jgi:hypothetical protein
MRILVGIAVCMMHAVKDSISAGVQERRSLGKKSKKIKETLPGLIHAEHFVRRVAMQEESLAKKRKEPVGKKENQDVHFIGSVFVYMIDEDTLKPYTKTLPVDFLWKDVKKGKAPAFTEALHKHELK